MIDTWWGGFSERALLLLAAMALAALVFGRIRGVRGDFWNAPGRSLKEVLQSLERRLNRDGRPAEIRRQRGGMTLAVCALTAALMAWWIESVLHAQTGGKFLELMVLAWLLPVRSAVDAARGVLKALARGEDLEKARAALAGSVWRNALVLDAHGLARAGMESLAVQFGHLVAASFWYMLLGLPGIVLSRMIRTMYEQWAMSAVGAENFGRPALMSESLFNGFPARLGAFLLLAASIFIPMARPRGAWSALRLCMRRTVPHDGWLLSGMAGATHTQLGGPVSVYLPSAWVGSGNPRASVRDLRFSLYVYALALLLWVLLLALCA